MKSYIPTKLPLDNLDYKPLLRLLGEANIELARYDDLLQTISNSTMMLSLLATMEALVSSKCAGIQATIEDVLEHQAGLIKEEQKDISIQQISNYRQAFFQSSVDLKRYSFRLGLVRETHKVMLKTKNGKNRKLGYFRTDQTWIGNPGCLIEEALFVPPDPIKMESSLTNWEKYVDLDDGDILLQTAIMHAQFELIRPFNDGNGRIGRILIPLFLYYKNKLSKPLFFMSEYFEDNKDEYYQCLLNISQKCDWYTWLSFFLKAIVIQAQKNCNIVKQIISFYDIIKLKIHDIINSKYTSYFLDVFFSKPIFNTSECANVLYQKYKVHKHTTLGILRQLKDSGILQELQPGKGRKASILCFPDLINLFNNIK